MKVIAAAERAGIDKRIGWHSVVLDKLVYRNRGRTRRNGFGVDVELEPLHRPHRCGLGRGLRLRADDLLTPYWLPVGAGFAPTADPDFFSGLSFPGCQRALLIACACQVHAPSPLGWAARTALTA
jgi:hypothetical protein